MNEDNEEFNQRQYELMLRTIELFRKGSISFGHLIANLEALLGALRQTPEPWRGRFESLWGKLEDTNAVMLDEGRRDFNDFDRTLIEESLSALESLVLPQIRRSDLLSS